MAALDVIRLVAEFAIAGQQILNVYHAVSTGSHSVSDDQDDLLDEIDQNYGLINNHLANNVVYDLISMTNLTGASDMGQFNWPNLAAGASAAEFLPTGVAGLITLPTSILKRRGRKFIAGVVETSHADSLFSATYLTAFALLGSALSNTFIGQTSGDPWAWGIMSTVDGLFYPHQGYSVTNVPAYQRRRRAGVGS